MVCLLLWYFASEVHATPFPHCHKIEREDVWNRKVFACAVDPPPRNSTEPSKKYKLNFYVQSQRPWFKDRFRFKVIGGAGIDGVNNSVGWLTRPPYISMWFECSRKKIPYDPEKPDGLKIETAYCPIDVFIENRNLILDSKLGMMFHVDDFDAKYDLPPQELLGPEPPLQPGQYKRPSPAVQAFKTVGKILLLVTIITALIVGIGLYIFRSCSQMWADPETKKAKSMSDRDRIVAALQKSERIAQRNRELGIPQNRRFDPRIMEDLSSSSDSGDSSESLATTRRRARARAKQRRTPMTQQASQSHRTSQPRTDRELYDEEEREFERRYQAVQQAYEERQRVLWQVRPNSRAKPKQTRVINARPPLTPERNEESQSINTNSSSDSGDDLNPLLRQNDTTRVARRRV
ncbi:hypothetical protein BLNAU_2795 [Blattamonas nauphoetae]|uniref:Uncharacterized protein n=1 Tax=Blattamonas nauphoetae TaxID=2049346 RepID=A0ABQ9YEM2_9EUKA|nr:hypothetical protein BLNAU_2795 [Blattamonas nauphoetae]